MVKRGKKYLNAAEKVDRDREYHPEEAIKLLKEISYANFDETIEAHFRLNIDPRQADQAVRSTVVLPHGTGREIRVLVFAAGEAARLAEEAGADYVGSDDLVARINDGWLEFDATIAMADQMSKVGGLGRILGRRGLMPNPRAGTVVRDAEDLPDVIRSVKGGRVEFRNDRTGLIHNAIGKRSFDDQQLLENLLALTDAIQRARPDAVRGQFCQSIYIASTMSPGIKLDVAETLAAAEASVR
ncbi:MAG TPA: 50S ribosomal protein L1 [Thermomicrobiales bacterium]|nr:50S ribosomal protein L1 [Thermomicrobiales bacterium]